MKNRLFTNGIFALILIVATAFTTCSVTGGGWTQRQQTADTLFMRQLRMERHRTDSLILAYQTTLAELSQRNDSLRQQVTTNKKLMSSYRFKASYLQQTLTESLTLKADSGGKVKAGDIAPIIDSLVTAQAQSDSACDSIIDGLESIVANRDSAIIVHEQVEASLRDLGKEQELRTAYLTEQLNTAFKVQRRKSRQNKVLAGGILILSGITTSLLLTHSLR